MKYHFLLAWFCLSIFLNSCQSSTDKTEKDLLEKELVKDETELEKEEKDFIKEKEEVDKMMGEKATLESLDFLLPLKDKYPHEVGLLDNALLKARMIRLIGDKKYDYLKKIWQVESPVEIKDSIFYAWGMEAHSGGDPSGVIMANLRQNVLYVGIRQDGIEKMYSENDLPVPTRLMEWANEQ